MITSAIIILISIFTLAMSIRAARTAPTKALVLLFSFIVPAICGAFVGINLRHITDEIGWSSP